MDSLSCCISNIYFKAWFEDDLGFVEDLQSNMSIPLTFPHLSWVENSLAAILQIPVHTSFRKNSGMIPSFHPPPRKLKCIVWPPAGGRMRLLCSSWDWRKRLVCFFRISDMIQDFLSKVGNLQHSPFTPLKLDEEEETLLSPEKGKNNHLNAIFANGLLMQNSDASTYWVGKQKGIVDLSFNCFS